MVKIHATRERQHVQVAFDWSRGQAEAGVLAETKNWDAVSTWHNSHFLDPKTGSSWVIYLPDQAWSGEVRMLAG